MISEKRGTHLYLKPDNKEIKSFGSVILSSDYSSDVLIDLSSLEITDQSLVFSLNQINQDIVSKGFCLVIVLKEAPSISDIQPLNIVPTLIEAVDYIQMEQIQRDLKPSL
tara:strand:- start:1593 stop:1922 length:330 start_codon:yes stop_codon:yes gene_type:complete